MHTEPQQEHQWLNQFIGEWTWESECSMGPDQPPTTTKGTEVVRSLGGLWIIVEGEGDMPEGGSAKTIMTLGFDPQKERFVGTFVASMMTFLWPYNGSLDADKKILTLDSEGPNFSTGTIVPYQDIIELVSIDHKILRSQIQMEDGTWNQFMTAHYHRQK
jgi:Protein of unknown function (DUF1579)